MKTKVALVTGGNRGLGLEICRQLGQKGFHIILASRSSYKSKKSLDYLKNSVPDISITPTIVDVADYQNIEILFKFVLNKFGKLDMLINNAGIYLDNHINGNYPSIFNLDVLTLQETLKVNAFGPLVLMQKFIPLMIKNNYGRIVNVSSGMGRIQDLDTKGPFYRISKLTLNALTIIFAKTVADHNILINSVCPGWVSTRMGGKKALISVEEGASGIVWAATLPADGPNGVFFRNKKQLDWSKKLSNF